MSYWKRYILNYGIVLLICLAAMASIVAILTLIYYLPAWTIGIFIFLVFVAGLAKIITDET